MERRSDEAGWPPRGASPPCSGPAPRPTAGPYDLVCRARQPGDLATLVEKSLFGGFFADGSSLALMTLVEPAAALAALDASGLFTPGSLRTRPLVHNV